MDWNFAANFILSLGYVPGAHLQQQHSCRSMCNMLLRCIYQNLDDRKRKVTSSLNWNGKPVSEMSLIRLYTGNIFCQILNMNTAKAYFFISTSAVRCMLCVIGWIYECSDAVYARWLFITFRYIPYTRLLTQMNSFVEKCVCWVYFVDIVFFYV